MHEVAKLLAHARAGLVPKLIHYNGHARSTITISISSLISGSYEASHFSRRSLICRNHPPSNSPWVKTRLLVLLQDSAVGGC